MIGKLNLFNENGNCHVMVNVYSKTTFLIDYMIVKLMTMRPDFILITTLYSITVSMVRGDVIYYEGLLYWILDAYMCLYS